MSFDDFKQFFTRISSATSVQGKLYTKISVKSNDIYFLREIGSYEAIPLKELYDVYMKCNFVNTTILRNYISGRKFSASLAILIESGLYDKKGNRKSENEIIPQNDLVKEYSPVNSDETNEAVETTEKDEAKFFAAFVNLVDSKFVKAKSLYKPVNSSRQQK
jgi:hypothetical protein